MVESLMPPQSSNQTAWVFWARLFIALLQGAGFFALFLFDNKNKIILEYPSIINLLPIPTLTVIPFILIIFINTIKIKKLLTLLFLNILISIFISYITLFNLNDLIEQKQLLDNNVDTDLIFFIIFFHVFLLFLVNSIIFNFDSKSKINILKNILYDLNAIFVSLIISIFIVLFIVILSQTYFIYMPITRNIVFFSIFAASVHCMDRYHYRNWPRE